MGPVKKPRAKMALYAPMTPGVLRKFWVKHHTRRLYGASDSRAFRYVCTSAPRKA
jgi:hypothetical protein